MENSELHPRPLYDVRADEAQILRVHLSEFIEQADRVFQNPQWVDVGLRLGASGWGPWNTGITIGELLMAWRKGLLVFDHWPELGRVYVLGFGGSLSGSCEWRGCTASGRMVFGGSFRRSESPQMLEGRLVCGAEFAPDLSVGRPSSFRAALRKAQGSFRYQRKIHRLPRPQPGGPRGLRALAVALGFDVADYVHPDIPEVPVPDEYKLSLAEVVSPPVVTVPLPSPTARISGGSCFGNEWPWGDVGD